MYLEAIKVLLEAQDRAFKSALDIIIEQLTARIQAAENRIEDLTTEVIYNSLEFKKSRVRHGKKQVNRHEVDRRKASVTGS